MQINKVYVGNNLDVLKTFPDNSIDSIVTDPPYGLGKEPNAHEVLKDWLEHGYHEIKGKGFMGKEWDSFVPQPILWKECLRVLKHGGHLLSFAGTRTYDWIVMGLRLAGFEIRDQIAWLYGSGFPKSHDISKAIDKSKGAEREVLGKAKGVGSNNTLSMKNGLGESQEFANEYDITAPSTDEAKQWQGYGTALKPALEPIVMARKPLKGTVASNVLKYGTGGLNIDGCRVELKEGEETWSHGDLGKFENVGEGYQRKNKSMFVNKGEASGSDKGRFPANVIHDGSEEVLNNFPNTEAGGNLNKIYKDKGHIFGDYKVKNEFESYGDSGSASRFFYTAKASQSERNFGLYGFEEKFTASAEFRPNHMEKALEGDNGNPYGRWQPKKNIHPTVKPIDLMQYLVRLVTPKGGICLDPYLGSGTTAIACKSEKINYIGIELEPEYAKIAESRIKAETVQYDIFDFLDES